MQSLRHQCHTVLSGHKEPSPQHLFEMMAQWCSKYNVSHDTYGEGDLLQQLEKKVADLLGFESALFIVTGSMCQPTALQIACKEQNNNLVAMHPTSHILLHENQGYQLQNRFNVLPIGHLYRTLTADDIRACPEKLAAVLYELPMREIGGQLPQWQTLNQIKAYCAEQSIHLHMDGARLWECAAYYGKTYAEISAGFNSVYVSLYKGVGGLGGSLLVGSQSMIDQAKVWVRRQGGDLYHRTPYVVSAMMQFDQRLQQMPLYYQRTQQIYALINRDFKSLTLNPSKPQANMLHLYLPIRAEKAIQIRDELATEKGVWLGNPQATALTEQCKIEWYVGDSLLSISDMQLTDILNWVITRCEQS